MPLVMNALDKENVVRVGGNTFTFKPNQIKEIYNEDIAGIMTRTKAEFGFVGLPQELTYIVHLKDPKNIEPEHISVISAAKKQGIDNYVQRLRGLVYNAQVSLKKDLEHKNYKQDVRTEWSEGDFENLEELVKYQSTKSDDSQKRIDRAKDLEKKLGG